jgi:predicted DCC family thiol-disulfide oxidoreductase YuxK
MATPREPLLVFYDGACAVCTQSISWAIKMDRYQRLQPIAAGSHQAHQIVGPAHAPRLLDELHVWSQSGGLRVGSDAVAAMLRQLPMLGWAGHVLAFPLVRPFARIVYRQIAQNRKACDRAFAMERMRRGPDVRRIEREPLM